MFYPWRRLLGPGIDVVAGERTERAPRRNRGELVDAALHAMDLEEPHAFFGHSFGALLAYRVARSRVTAGHPPPRALVLSSYAPPHLPRALPDVGHLDDDRLAALLSDIGGLPQSLADWPVLQRRAVGAARHDLRLCATDDSSDTGAVPCPIHAVGGREDPLVSEDDLDEWRSYTTGGFSLNMLPGGHFHLDDAMRTCRVLRTLLARG